LKLQLLEPRLAFEMKTQHSAMQSAASARWPRARWFIPFSAFAFLALPARAHASLFHGETLDSIANVISWVAIVIAPIRRFLGTRGLLPFAPQ